MDVRTIRVRIAAKELPMVIAGHSRCAKLPDPDTGSHPKLMAKNKISTGPSAKLGNDKPKRLITLRARSSQRLRLCAERTPAGIESTIATTSAEMVNCRV